MSIPYESSTVLDTPMPSGESFIDYPFLAQNDTTTKVYCLHCVVKESDYTPIALDTTMASAANADVTSLPFAADANAYHIGDYNHQIIDGIFRSFERKFANIPSVHADNSGTEIFTFPGLRSTAGVGTRTTVISSSSFNNQVTLSLAAAHGMSVGDDMRVYLRYSRTANGRFYSVTLNGNRTVTAVPSSTSVTFRSYLVGYTLSSGYIYPNATRGRLQVSRVSPTQIVSEYFLPGVTSGISNPQDIPIEQPFEAYLYTEGNEVTQLTSSTTPTNAEYIEIMDQDGYLIMQENVKQWMGNILVKESKQIRAM